MALAPVALILRFALRGRIGGGDPLRAFSALGALPPLRSLRPLRPLTPLLLNALRRLRPLDALLAGRRLGFGAGFAGHARLIVLGLGGEGRDGDGQEQKGKQKAHGAVPRERCCSFRPDQ